MMKQTFTQNITVSVGPGPYVEDLIAALRDAALLDRVIYFWPDLRVLGREGDPAHWNLIYQAGWYRHFVRLVWSTWRRLPVLGNSEYPRLWVDRVYDYVAARHMGKPRIFVGWSQVCLHSIAAAKHAGATVVLEHPMLHVEEWQRLIPEECGRLGVDPRECYSVVPDAMAMRMKQEYASADRIMVPSRAAVDSFVAAGIAPEKMLSAPFGVDLGMFHPISGDDRSDGRPFRALFAGRIEILKGISYLLEAWRSLKLKNAELLLVGPVLPEMKSVLAKYEDCGIRLLHDVPRNQLTALYNAADVFVFPSLCDGFGIVMLEAMACGVAVIASTNCGGPDCVREGQNGYLVPIRNAEAIAEKIAILYRDRELARVMGEASRTRAEKDFTLQHYAQRLTGIYAGLLHERKAAEAS